MVNFNKRDMAILNTVSTIWSYDYIELYLAVFLPPAITSSYLSGTQMLGISSIEPAVKISNFVQQTLNSLDDYELKKKIYTENIRTFYGSNSSQVLDNIKATSEILSMMNLCIRRLTNSGHQITAMKNQIYSDVYNDYLIQNEQIQIDIYDSIDQSLTTINDLTDKIYVLTFIFLVLYVLTIVLVMKKYYEESMMFLRVFTTHPIEDLNHRLKKIENLRALIEKGVTNDNNHSIKDEGLVTISSKIDRRSYSTKKLILNIFALRLLVFFFLLVPSIFLLAFCYNFSYSNYNTIMRQTKNILKISKISMKTASLYHIVTLNDVLVNTMVARNNYARDKIDEYLDELRDMISVSEISDDQLNNMFSESLCRYYNYSSADCNTALNGIGKQGTRAFIYSLTDLYANERNELKGKTYDFYTVVGLLTRPYRSDVYALTIYGLIPSCIMFVSQLEEELLSFLRGRLDDIIISFVFSIIIDLGSLVVVTIMVYMILVKERKKIINIMKLVPLEFMMRNMDLRMFLIKDNRNFLSLFKKMELSLGGVKIYKRKS